MAQLLLGANATVTICHSRTRDLPGVCRRADVLIAAVGRPRMVGADWVKPGATVIDVGINRTSTDVPLSATSTSTRSREVAGAITPVPGGVGPDDDRVLLRNTAEGGPHGRGRGRLSVRRLRRADWLILLSAIAVPVTLVPRLVHDRRRARDAAGASLGWATLALIVLAVVARRSRSSS